MSRAVLTKSPLHRENRKNGPKRNPCQGKHKEFGNFANTQGIWFAQVVNFLILKIQDYCDICHKILQFFQSVSLMKLSQISEIGTRKIFSWTGKTQGICK